MIFSLNPYPPFMHEERERLQRLKWLGKLGYLWLRTQLPQLNLFIFWKFGLRNMRLLILAGHIWYMTLIKVPVGFNPNHVYTSCSFNTRVWYAGFNGNSHVFTSMALQIIGQASKEMMHQRSFPSIVFWPLLSILSFCVKTHWVSVLRRRSAISHDNNREPNQ